jgi:hypothetical protein
MILSIDVGIKNLSVCCIECQMDKYSIQQWDVIDLTSDEPIEICGFITTKGKCTKPSTFSCNNTHLCGIHVNKSDIKRAPDIYYKCVNKSRPSKKNIADINSMFSLVNYTSDQTIDYVTTNCMTKRVKSKSASDLALINLGISIYHKLPGCIKLENITKVLIENQIGPLANRMKCIQGMLTQFFIQHGIHDISYISSSNKLKFFECPKKTYKERKSSGIHITQELLKTKPDIGNWLAWYNTHKKKDDLADSFLQGLWFIRHG